MQCKLFYFWKVIACELHQSHLAFSISCRSSSQQLLHMYCCDFLATNKMKGFWFFVYSFTGWKVHSVPKWTVSVHNSFPWQRPIQKIYFILFYFIFLIYKKHSPLPTKSEQNWHQDFLHKGFLINIFLLPLRCAEIIKNPPITRGVFPPPPPPTFHGRCVQLLCQRENGNSIHL